LNGLATWGNGVVESLAVDILMLRGAVIAVLVVSVLAVGVTADASPGADSPLVGTWRTTLISQADAEATLRRHGLAKWIRRFRRQTPFGVPMQLILVVGRDWDLYGKPQGGSREPIDYDADYVVRGRTIDKVHATGFTTLRWSVNGGVLKTTEPPYMGIPDKVFQYALYMSKNFARVR
jgi:hypothetical protein